MVGRQNAPHRAGCPWITGTPRSSDDRSAQPRRVSPAPARGAWRPDGPGCGSAAPRLRRRPAAPPRTARSGTRRTRRPPGRAAAGGEEAAHRALQLQLLAQDAPLGPVEVFEEHRQDAGAAARSGGVSAAVASRRHTAAATSFSCDARAAMTNTLPLPGIGGDGQVRFRPELLAQPGGQAAAGGARLSPAPRPAPAGRASAPPGCTAPCRRSAASSAVMRWCSSAVWSGPASPSGRVIFSR